MDLTTLRNTPPWDWPEDAANVLLGTLHDAGATAADRLVAVELASEVTVINQALAAALLSILHDEGEAEELRGSAAICLGPVLELADMDGFEDPDAVPISENTFHGIQEALRSLYTDANVPKYVRRRILEASVRAPQDWHREAILAAHSSGDEDWKLTAVFSMRWVRGFDEQILEALESDNQDVYYEAICAAGNRELDGAWPHVAALVASEDTDRRLLLAAIDAAASIRPHEAGMVLAHLTESDDQDIVEAAHGAMGIAEARTGAGFCCDGEDDGPFQ